MGPGLLPVLRAGGGRSRPDPAALSRPAERGQPRRGVALGGGLARGQLWHGRQVRVLSIDLAVDALDLSCQLVG